MAKGSLERGRLRAGKRLTIAEALGMVEDDPECVDRELCTELDRNMMHANGKAGFVGYLCHAFRTAAERLEQGQCRKIGNGDLNGDLLVSVELEAGETEAALGAGQQDGLVIVGPSDRIATVLAKNFGKNSKTSIKATRDSTDLHSALEEINTAARAHGERLAVYAHGERLAVYAVSIGKGDGGTKWYLDVAVGGPDSVWREMGPGLG